MPPAAARGRLPFLIQKKTMPTPFQHAVAELCQSLSLQPPEQIDNALFTLQVGEHALHLSEQPAHQLLMFCCLSPQQAQADAPPLRQNLFSDDPLAGDRPIRAQPGLGAVEPPAAGALRRRRAAAAVGTPQRLRRTMLPRAGKPRRRPCAAGAAPASRPAALLSGTRSARKRPRPPAYQVRRPSLGRAQSTATVVYKSTTGKSISVPAIRLA